MSGSFRIILTRQERCLDRGRGTLSCWAPDVPTPGFRPAAQGTSELKTFLVYLVNQGRASKVQVGTLVERRTRDRGDNIAGLLKLAGNRFKSSPDQKIQVDFKGFRVEL